MTKPKPPDELKHRPNRAISPALTLLACPLCRRKGTLRVVAYRRVKARMACRSCGFRFTVTVPQALDDLQKRLELIPYDERIARTVPAEDPRDPDGWAAWNDGMKRHQTGVLRMISRARVAYEGRNPRARPERDQARRELDRIQEHLLQPTDEQRELFAAELAEMERKHAEADPPHPDE